MISPVPAVAASQMVAQQARHPIDDGGFGWLLLAIVVVAILGEMLVKAFLSIKKRRQK